MKLEPHDTELCGRWNLIDGKMVPDEVCTRIEALTSEYLKKIGTDPSGWDMLYQDPWDKRFWELVYLESEIQGGGPPTLRIITNEEVRKKYKVKA